MRIDRAEFLELTFLLGLAACDHGAAAPTAPIVIPLQPAPPPSAAPPPAAAPPIASASPDGCSNDVGSPAACTRIGPACEGVADSCPGLFDQYKPRVAERLAECLTKVRPPQCQNRGPSACEKKAFEAACPEPFAAKLCTGFIDQCRAAKKPAKYTLDLCTKVLSSIKGGPGSEPWDNANVDLLGPSAESGSCSLLYVSGGILR
jgi:hypothetical protein